MILDPYQTLEVLELLRRIASTESAETTGTWNDSPRDVMEAWGMSPHVIAMALNDPPKKTSHFRYVNFDVDKADWLIMLRHYRTMRIRLASAPPGEIADGTRSEGFSYGLSRAEAKNLITTYWRELSWLTYIGSK